MKNNIEWFGCPNLSPKQSLMCSKPIGHKGLCEAQGCQSILESWPPNLTREKQVPWPITVDQNDVNDFGLDISKYQEHKDLCKSLQSNSWLMFGV